MAATVILIKLALEQSHVDHGSWAEGGDGLTDEARAKLLEGLRSVGYAAAIERTELSLIDVPEANFIGYPDSAPSAADG